MDFSSSKLFLFVALPILMVSSFVVLQHQKNPIWSFSQYANNNSHFFPTSLRPPFAINSSIFSPPDNHSPRREQLPPPPPPPPPTATEALKDQPKVEKNDDSRYSNNSNWISSIRKKKMSNLEKVEAGLARSRGAIKEAQYSKESSINHTDYVPTGPMYWNPNAFQREWGPMKNTTSDYIDSISMKYPYWNRSIGSDHFMLACHDWAPEISLSVPYLYKNSIRVLCNANTSERFDPSKDVSMPEIYLPSGTISGLIGGPSASKRPILVFYAGGIHGYIRAVLMKHWENKDRDVQVHQYLPRSVSYHGMIKKSKYCICPSGYEVASPRMVESLYMGCVPVLIKDHYVAPFSDVLNWNSFSVSIDVKDISKLKNILMKISQKDYIRMQRRGVQVRRHFEVNFPPKRYDVFHMILHSIWLRRLNIQVHE